MLELENDSAHPGNELPASFAVASVRLERGVLVRPQRSREGIA